VIMARGCSCLCGWSVRVVVPALLAVTNAQREVATLSELSPKGWGKFAEANTPYRYLAGTWYLRLMSVYVNERYSAARAGFQAFSLPRAHTARHTRAHDTLGPIRHSHTNDPGPYGYATKTGHHFVVRDFFL
jgi:hypothetical protein